MFTRTMLRLTTLAALLSLLIACDKAVSPGEIPDQSIGEFILVAAEGASLPAPVFDGVVVADPDPSFHLRIVATSGSITIDATGHYEQRVSHDAFVDGALNGRATHVDRGECTRSGALLQCSSNYIEGVAFTGTFAGKTLTIGQDLAGEGHVAQYRYSR
jgi:hypothetical protein